MIYIEKSIKILTPPLILMAWLKIPNMMLGGEKIFCLEITKGGGYAHLNKTIMGYNQSIYGTIKDYKGRAVDTLTLFKDKGFPKETRDYLAKVLGVNGFLHLYAKENL